MPAWEVPKQTKKKRSPVMPIAFVAVIVAAVVGGFLYVRSKNQTSAAPAAQASTPAPAVPVSTTLAETGTVVPVSDTTSTLVATDTTLTQAPALDPNLVNEEVQRRLAAERARLEAQTRAQQQAAAPQPQPATPILTPPVRPAPAVTQTVAQQQPPPQPVPQPPAPVPQPTATVADTRPAPQPQPTTPAAPQVREGDLVDAGADGLIPARVIRYGTVPYPPMARAQRVQGTVILRVLVDEKGQVSDVRIVTPLARAFGLNEAAEQIIRRSTFAPPMLDGVRVKSWTTVPVKFTL
jgi:protein TonB